MPNAKRTFLLFLFLSVLLKGPSQTEDPQAENVLDELFALESLAVNEILQGVKKDALYLNLGFDEQAIFLGVNDLLFHINLIFPKAYPTSKQ